MIAPRRVEALSSWSVSLIPEPRVPRTLPFSKRAVRCAPRKSVGTVRLAPPGARRPASALRRSSIVSTTVTGQSVALAFDCYFFYYYIIAIIIIIIIIIIAKAIRTVREAEEVKALVKEIEDRCCLEWPEISEAVDKIRPRHCILSNTILSYNII